MKKLNLNKIIKASSQKPKSTIKVDLESNFPIPLKSTVFLDKKNNKRITIICKETNPFTLKIFAKAVFLMYRKKFLLTPNKITFLTPEGKKTYKNREIELVTLDPLFKFI